MKLTPVDFMYKVEFNPYEFILFWGELCSIHEFQLNQYITIKGKPDRIREFISQYIYS